MILQSKIQNALVCCSGGIDSTTAVAWAMAYAENKPTLLGFDYQQRHVKEIACGTAVAAEYRLPYKVLNITIPDSPLHARMPDKIPHKSYAEIEGVSPSYVWFRNGLFIANAVAYAHANKLDTVVIGPHAEDAAGFAYPDCTVEFFGAMANAVHIGTYGEVRLVAPFLTWTKAQIVRYGSERHVPYHLTWSCYRGGDKHCGTCPTCIARKEAFWMSDNRDPTEYEM